MTGAGDELGLPRDLNVETGEDTHDEEADTRVSHAGVESGDEHDGTDTRQGNGANLIISTSLANPVDRLASAFIVLDLQRARPSP